MTPNRDYHARIRFYNWVLLFVAGLGGLLYGVDIGIIAGALPYLEATSDLTAGQISNVVAAVLLGSVISTLFAGLLADWMGRRPLMMISGVVFVASIPLIALSHGYGSLMLGRLLQGISAGLIGVVVPLYLAECLGAANRGKGTAIFQWLLTLGIVAAAAISMYFSIRVEAITKLGNADQLFAFKDLAWRRVFWVSMPPGLLFILGCLLMTESPRWLFSAGMKEAARAALRRSRLEEQADLEFAEMEERAAVPKAPAAAVRQVNDPLISRRYVIPFLLACLILACNQATGAASIIGYNTTILLQAGLSDLEAHWGYVILTVVNFIATIGGVVLVDRLGRKILLSIGTAGIMFALLSVGLLFYHTERGRVDCRDAVQKRVGPDQKLTLTFNRETSAEWLAAQGAAERMEQVRAHMLVVIYSYGDFRAATRVVRSDDGLAAPVEISRECCVPARKILAFFSNPFANLAVARQAPLTIDNALITPVPARLFGILTAIGLFVFMAFFAIGPGICVWLALSELMPTRIRSNGMSIALLLNQAVSTTIAALFLPTVGRYGYSMMFFVFAGCTVVYFVVAFFFLPETSGKTLEEIEAFYEK